MFSTREILDLSERLERNGERFYRESLSKFSDPSLIALLRWLADEELRHKEWFAERKARLRPAPGDREAEEIGSDLLKEILGSQTFSLNGADISSIEDPGALVELALEFEGDTILFYQMIGSLVGERETAKHIEEIIAEEETHVRSLRSLKPPAYKPSKKE